MNKTSSAKLKGNRIHTKLKSMCLNWMKRHQKERVAKFREQARKQIEGLLSS